MFVGGNFLVLLGILIYPQIAIAENSVLATISSTFCFLLGANCIWRGEVTPRSPYLTFIPAAVIVGIALYLGYEYFRIPRHCNDAKSCIGTIALPILMAQLVAIVVLIVVKFRQMPFASFIAGCLLAIVAFAVVAQDVYAVASGSFGETARLGRYSTTVYVLAAVLIGFGTWAREASVFAAIAGLLLTVQIVIGSYAAYAGICGARCALFDPASLCGWGACFSPGGAIWIGVPAGLLALMVFKARAAWAGATSDA